MKNCRKNKTVIDLKIGQCHDVPESEQNFFSQGHNIDFQRRDVTEGRLFFFFASVVTLKSNVTTLQRFHDKVKANVVMLRSNVVTLREHFFETFFFQVLENSLNMMCHIFRACNRFLKLHFYHRINIEA